MPDTDARKAWLAAHRDELRAYHRDWAAKNRARIKEYADARKAKEPEKWAKQAREKTRQYRERNPEKSAEQGRLSQARRRDKHPEVVKAQARKGIIKWRKLNPERHKELNRLSSHRHPETNVINAQKRRAKLRAAPGSGVTRREWRDVVAAYHGLCVYCHAKPARLYMDHVEPINKGGSHEPDNIVPACGKCNSSKSDKTLIVWLAVRRSARGK
jgi:5-methylcytosine-specific restriction endonuclease McrA